jgi:glycosyltransferase involved in cell wall biosynthesis
VVPYGVDPAAFSPAARSAGMRARLGIADDTFLVLGLGRLVEKKGFRDLVAAAARLDAVQVAIVGDGDLGAALRQEAAAAGVAVQFPGALAREDVPAALAAADVVAVPSVVDAAGNVDGLPNVLLEALAAGRPVVASRVAGIPDVVEDGVNGLLVPPNDAAALAGAIRRLQQEPSTRRALGEEARRRAVLDLTWEAAARRFEECYAEAAALDAR